MAGKLYICGTPIGNMEDMTLRGLRILKEADLIAAEDTRNTIKILNSYDIKTPLTSYHKFNEEEKGKKLVEKLKEGANIALVSDAGMPGISDPGEVLINMCITEGIEVTVVPGPTAFVSALVLSGIGSRSFVFEGFLPSNKHMRREVLNRLKTETRTTVFYEAPHHLADTLKEMYEAAGDRPAAAVREITKKHEEAVRLSLKELSEYFRENAPKGEFVIVIGGISKTEEKSSVLTVKEQFELFLEQGFERKEAMKLCAKERGVSKKEIYAELLGKKSENRD
ncbi:MAG: 16S rRNA (cytidine(1402)-2'-O)-methyltransferase [Clostridiales bacterium]|nr:16S rRNA (cytidine(1402)-2'-O)-methyltransferase [Clostridiales bacterium]